MRIIPQEMGRRLIHLHNYSLPHLQHLEILLQIITFYQF